MLKLDGSFEYPNHMLKLDGSFEHPNHMLKLDGSFEHPNHMLKLMIKNLFIIFAQKFCLSYLWRT